ncbi:MAG TPA: DUF3189 family protein [Bacillota bacterium]
MKLVYYGFFRGYTARVAGAIHLHRLPEDRLPTLDQLINYAGFEGNSLAAPGVPQLLGRDEAQNEIYCLGLGTDPAICLQTICHLLAAGADPFQWRFIPTGRPENPLIRWGNFCSGKAGLAILSSFLTWLGIQHCYFRLVEQVRQVKEWPGVAKT